MKVSLTLAAICSLVAGETPFIPDGLKESLLALVAKPDTKCLPITDCDKCKTATCSPCNLNSAGTYAWKNIDEEALKPLDTYKIRDNNFACVGASAKAKCEKIDNIFLEAQESHNLVKDYEPVTYSCNAVDILKDDLIDLASKHTDANCTQITDCHKCTEAKCNACALNAIGDYAFDKKNSFFTEAELQEFTTGQISSKLVCGGVMGKCLAVAADTVKVADDLNFPKGWKQVGVNDCGAVPHLISAGATLLTFATLFK